MWLDMKSTFVHNCIQENLVEDEAQAQNGSRGVEADGSPSINGLRVKEDE